MDYIDGILTEIDEIKFDLDTKDKDKNTSSKVMRQVGYKTIKGIWRCIEKYTGGRAVDCTVHISSSNGKQFIRVSSLNTESQNNNKRSDEKTYILNNINNIEEQSLKIVYLNNKAMMISETEFSELLVSV